MSKKWESMTNFERHRWSHEFWNKRDFDAFAPYFEPTLDYTDHERGEKVTSLDAMRQFATNWWKSFSDAQIADNEYTDAGEWTICKFTIRATNDGPFMGHPVAGRKVAFDGCEWVHWTEKKTCQGGDMYMSLLSLIVQLGFVKR